MPYSCHESSDQSGSFSNGVLQPYRLLGWWKWMYRLSPYTYLIEGLLGQMIGDYPITCSPIEYVTINPPAGLTCGEYMAPYMSYAGGYLTNPSESAACQFCSTRTTNEFLELNFNIFYSHAWRNVGLLVAFTFFNVSRVHSRSPLLTVTHECIQIFLMYLLTYLFRIRTGPLFPSFKRTRKN